MSNHICRASKLRRLPQRRSINGDPVQGDHCAFPRDAAFAIEPVTRPEVIMISPAGRARRFASLPPGSALTGIAFDATGWFGHKLLVTAGLRGRTTVFGIGCDGGLSPVTADGPPVEGGIVVAPAAFGAFGGDLIAPNETSGRVYAMSPSGKVVILARSGLPAGGDIGVESAGFVPAAAAAAYLADRFSRGNKHPGDDAILRLSAAGLALRPGQATSSSPPKAAEDHHVRCAATCAVRYVAAGPAIPTRKAISFSRRLDLHGSRAPGSAAPPPRRITGSDLCPPDRLRSRGPARPERTPRRASLGTRGEGVRLLPPDEPPYACEAQARCPTPRHDGRPRRGMPAIASDELRLRLLGVQACDNSSDDTERFVRTLRWLAEHEKT